MYSSFILVLLVSSVILNSFVPHSAVSHGKSFSEKITSHLDSLVCFG